LAFLTPLTIAKYGWKEHRFQIRLGDEFDENELDQIRKLFAGSNATLTTRATL